MEMRQVVFVTKFIKRFIDYTAKFSLRNSPVQVQRNCISKTKLNAQNKRYLKTLT